jgi:hypothetical protein
MHVLKTERTWSRGLVALAAVVVAACSGAKSPPPDEPAADAPSASTGDTEAPAASEPAADQGGGFSEAQEQQMIIALRRGGEKAAQCVDVVPDAPGGEGEVEVLFDGQKGRVTDATVGPPFKGAPVEACIRRAFVGEIVLPFDGPPKSVPYSVKLVAKKASAPADAKKGGKK